MSDVVYTVLISAATQGPWGDRGRLAPTEVATLYVGGSAKWVFTNLHGRPESGVRPAGPEFEGAALLVGLAAGCMDDDAVQAVLRSRPQEDGEDLPIGAHVDDDKLIARARQSVAGAVRLSVAGESISRDRASAAYLIEGLDGVEVELLVPVKVAEKEVLTTSG